VRIIGDEGSGRKHVSRVAIVTDSASDLSPEAAAAAGITIVPLAVRFGDDSFKAGVELSTAAFWERMLAPSAPFPTTAAASPGDFASAYERLFDDGAEGIVCVCISGELSGTLKSARLGAEMVGDREIHVIDTRSASMGEGILALIGTDMAAAAAGTAAEVAAALTRRLPDLDLYVALDTLEYLRKGGRMSAAQAAVGSLLAVKPIITVRDGKVEAADRARTRSKARERVLELLTAGPVERLAILYTPGADHESFREELVARVPGGIDPALVSTHVVGPSIGPHLGPGCLGGVILRRPT
jgi:DegV family protein with EDD domain